ncbi:hypothetical protein BGZ76_001089 [Entomortierella beljakovae]|nr:hypothetical protein BGZ76_001089 [Entomortierella beljakovae]
MPQGMPVIPPRLQQQQQQEVLEKHRRKQHDTQDSYGFQSNHYRSVSSGSGRARENRGNNNSNKLPSTDPYNRLRSESNPSFSTTSIGNSNSSSSSSSSRNGANNYNNHNNNNSSYESSWATNSSHSRANSSGSSASGYSSRVGNNFPSRNNSSSNTTGLSSFQERLKERDREKQQREREERDAAARAFREGKSNEMINIYDDMIHPELSSALNDDPSVTPAPSSGTSLWDRFRAAKDMITGEERWPDSDGSDYEGESHVTRILREYAEGKETERVAAKIAELEMMDKMPSPTTPAGPFIPSRKESIGKNRPRAPQRRNIDTSLPPISTEETSPKNNYGHTWNPPNTEATMRPGRRTGATITNNNVAAIRVNRFRTSSDASLSEALGRLEGKRNQDALVAQVSHLGSTRARSPHRGNRAYKDNIDTVPPPPLPTPKSNYRQQQSPTSPTSRSHAQLSPSSSGNNTSGSYGQRKQQQEQPQRNYI